MNSTDLINVSATCRRLQILVQQSLRQRKIRSLYIQEGDRNKFKSYKRAWKYLQPVILAITVNFSDYKTSAMERMMHFIGKHYSDGSLERMALTGSDMDFEWPDNMIPVLNRLTALRLSNLEVDLPMATWDCLQRLDIITEDRVCIRDCLKLTFPQLKMIKFSFNCYRNLVNKFIKHHPQITEMYFCDRYPSSLKHIRKSLRALQFTWHEEWIPKWLSKRKLIALHIRGFTNFSAFGNFLSDFSPLFLDTLEELGIEIGYQTSIENLWQYFTSLKRLRCLNLRLKYYDITYSQMIIEIEKIAQRLPAIEIIKINNSDIMRSNRINYKQLDRVCKQKHIQLILYGIMDVYDWSDLEVLYIL